MDRSTRPPIRLPATLRAAAAGLIAVATLGATLAAAPVQAQQPVRGGTLVAVIQPEPTVLTNVANNHYSNNVVSPNVFDGLLRYDEALNPQPGLAERWEVAPDNLSITFHLRRGVKWHDGADFTSADVRYSLLELWKALHPRGRTTFAAVTDVETPDAHTAVVRLSRPSPAILSALGAAESQVLPAHLYQGGDPLKNPRNNQPVGTGPFRFKAWQKGDHIEFERNPDYWDTGKPYIDRLIFRIIPDAASRAAAFESGDVQYGPYGPVPLADVERLTTQAGLKVETNGYAWLSQFFLFEFNLNDPVAGNPDVRKAIAHAIDRKGLIDVVWYGFGKPAVSPVPSHLARYHTADLPRYDFDPAAAERLLDKAGYPRKADGTRVSIIHDYEPSNEIYKNAAEYIRQNLKRVGIDVKLRSQDLASQQRRIYTDYDFTTRSGQFSSMMDPSMGLYRLYWSKSRLKGVPNTNASGYATPEMDGVIEATFTESDPAKRTALFHDWQRLAMADLPVIPLVELRHFTLYSGKLRGVSRGPDGAMAALKDVWFAP